jgi:hypothetical protein
MSAGKAVPLHEVERLIKQLENPIRSAKTRAAKQLESIQVFPTLIPAPQQFLHEVISPVLGHFANDTESVRQSCVNTVSSYVTQLGATNLNDTLDCVLPPVFARLKDEETEPAEEIRLSLMRLLLQLVGAISADTVPSTFDRFCDAVSAPLSVSLGSQNADMKKAACGLVDVVMRTTSRESLREVAPQLVLSLLPNCLHRHGEVRRISLASLGQLYVLSGVIDGVEKVADVIEKLVEDKVSSVRKTAISFLEKILSEHAMRSDLLFPLMVPLFAWLMPLVPLRRTDIEVEPKAIAETEDSRLAFAALAHIGAVYEADHPDLSEGIRQFDASRAIVAGLGEIVKVKCGQFIGKLLPMIVDWTEQTRRLGFFALRSFVHLCQEHATRYAPEIFQKLSQSLRDTKGDADRALQVGAVVASFVPGKDIVDFLLPKINEDGPKDTVLLLAVAVTNSVLDEETLTAIMDHFMRVHVYDAVQCIESLIPLVLAILRRSGQFATDHALTLLILILKICERADQLRFFLNAFGKPISDVFADHMGGLLEATEKTADYLTHLLLTAPAAAVAANQEIACAALMTCLDGDAKSKATTKN